MSNNILTQNDIQHVDYKDVDLLKQFINPHGRIMGRTKSGLTAKQQRAVEAAIKRARFMGLLPFIQKEFWIRGRSGRSEGPKRDGAWDREAGPACGPQQRSDMWGAPVYPEIASKRSPKWRPCSLVPCIGPIYTKRNAKLPNSATTTHMTMTSAMP